MSRYARMSREAVPQSEPLTASQIQNNAGGFVFALDDWARFDRFLVLGSDAPTYYQTARSLTRENAACVSRCFSQDPGRAAGRIAEVSSGGRAPKNDAAIFALAIGASHVDVRARQEALAEVPFVCRTSTHLFQFVDNCRALGRGWGRGLKRAVARWYETKDAKKLAYQVIKYRSRENYTHKRMLQTSHPVTTAADTEAVYRWVLCKDLSPTQRDWLPWQIRAHDDDMRPGASAEEIRYLVREYNLPWEALPTAATKDPEVWKIMLPGMGLTALIRNLGKMTALGVFKPLSAEVQVACARLLDVEGLRRDRIHPFTVLQALAVYRSGHGVRGDLSWTAVPQIVDALERAFYLSFKAVQPTGKPTLIALDVSGSMTSRLGGSPLSVREAAAAMAMVTVRTEGNHHVVGFTSAGSQGWSSGNRAWTGNGHISALPIGPNLSLDDVLRVTDNLPFGGTDCSLPMLYASAHGLRVETFIIYTDNETWAGTVHPVQALRDYRAKFNIPAKLIVVGMTSTGFSIADPDDGGMLDVVGFDSSAPAIMADFARG